MKLGIYTFLVFTLFLGGCKQASKIAFVDVVQVYEKFEYREILHNQLNKEIEIDQLAIDSFRLLRDKALQIAESSPDQSNIDRYSLLNGEYKTLFDEFEAKKQELVEEYDQKLWKQLNQYLKDYGKDNGLDLLLGANGSGAILYGKPDIDHTSDIVIYVNKKFNDVK